MKFLITGEKKPENEYDLVIIGGGPAGCTAGLYAGRFRIKTLIIANDFGGLINDAEVVDNYPGIPDVKGSELGKKFLEHAKKYGIETYLDEVIDIKKENKFFKIITTKNEIKAKAIILATGEKHRKLGVPGEKELTGKGVSYCAICDAPLFKGKEVAIVGGGNASFTEAQILAKHAKKVYLIHRRNWFRADPIEVERVKKIENIEIKTPYVIKEIKGNDKVEYLVLKKTREGNGKVVETDETKKLKVDGLFIAVGLIPKSELAKKIGVKLNEKGYVIVDDYMKTNVEGVFAAGDLTDKASKFRQIVLAAAQGAIAAYSAFEFLKRLD